MRVLDLTREIVESRMKSVTKSAATATRLRVYEETLIFQLSNLRILIQGLDAPS
jgi:hypothetical protein